MYGNRINRLHNGLCLERSISAFEKKRRMNLLSDNVLRSGTDKKCHVTGICGAKKGMSQNTLEGGGPSAAENASSRNA
ncbi:hypothetical protein CDAR_126591 [Caerostris darwini]|uniref:Uncharacterized protein n=1 Tax=Caerostris darwini TaxID=1538125 RepID=A0AAV4RXZ8_9ARAC|nr:hypothetical protein CDAR_126591 [Caerostris darwini]